MRQLITATSFLFTLLAFSASSTADDLALKGAKRFATCAGVSLASFRASSDWEATNDEKVMPVIEGLLTSSRIAYPEFTESFFTEIASEGYSQFVELSSNDLEKTEELLVQCQSIIKEALEIQVDKTNRQREMIDLMKERQ